MAVRRIGILGFNGVMALDVVGPFDAFSSVCIEDREKLNGYEVVIIGLSNKPFVAETGIVFKPHKTIRNAPALDTLIIPGGKGLRVPQTQRTVAEWVGECAARTRRIATVCTGTYGLAATGLLPRRGNIDQTKTPVDFLRRHVRRLELVRVQAIRSRAERHQDQGYSDGSGDAHAYG